MIITIFLQFWFKYHMQPWSLGGKLEIGEIRKDKSLSIGPVPNCFHLALASPGTQLAALSTPLSTQNLTVSSVMLCSFYVKFFNFVFLNDLNLLVPAWVTVSCKGRRNYEWWGEKDFIKTTRCRASKVCTTKQGRWRTQAQSGLISLFMCLQTLFSYMFYIFIYFLCL